MHQLTATESIERLKKLFEDVFQDDEHIELDSFFWYPVDKAQRALNQVALLRYEIESAISTLQLWIAANYVANFLGCEPKHITLPKDLVSGEAFSYNVIVEARSSLHKIHSAQRNPESIPMSGHPFRVVEVIPSFACEEGFAAIVLRSTHEIKKPYVTPS